MSFPNEMIPRFYSLSLRAAVKFVQALQNSAVKESVETLEGYMFCGASWTHGQKDSYEPARSRNWQHRFLECPLVL